MDPKRRRKPGSAPAVGRARQRFIVISIDRQELSRNARHAATLDEFLNLLQMQAEDASTAPADDGHHASERQLIRDLKTAVQVAEQAARNHAQLGVDRIVIRAVGKGRVRVTIGDFAECEMGQAVADTLLALAATTGGQPASDGLVGWKTQEDLAWSIKQRTGRTPSTHALSNNIYRLRGALVNGGNPFLVQTDAKRRLARFALSALGRIVDEGKLA